MSHNRSDSEQFSTSSSSFTSRSSEDSREYYEEKLKPRIQIVSESAVSLHELVDATEKIINDKFTHDSQSTFTYADISVQLDQVMLAMLACAEECGGESGKRYVASAILACSEDEDVVGALVALGTTWLTRFLFTFKSTKGHKNRGNEHLSGAATPTLDTTATHLLKGIGGRKISFLDYLKIRDRYTCVVTGYQDALHPNPIRGFPQLDLVGAHILPRAMGTFNKDHKSKFLNLASTTFDILVNFTRLPVKTLEELNDQIDHSSNGMLLQHDACDAFVRFDWCLKKTGVEHVYDLKIFKDRLLRKPHDNLVIFVDHGPPIDLPNPNHIAIHAAIAEVLNMSGAGRFFDELLNKYRDAKGISAVQSWPELETLVGAELLKESITQAFQSITVQ